jgi:putative nucleotidyltransferase with HDIG domain
MDFQIDVETNYHDYRSTQVTQPYSSFLTFDRAANEMYPFASASKGNNNEFSVILELVKKLNRRDIATGNHSKKMSGLAELTAVKLGYNAADAQVVLWSALLHDIGKTRIPDTVLYNPGPLSLAQWSMMKQHPHMGAEIILKAADLPRVAWLVLCHHEKWDGSGYPYGLKGEDIPLGARILSVADSYCAITDGRAYRAARSHDEAMDELQRFAGRYYDLRVIEAFFSIFE